MKIQEFFNIHLPKWAAMVVVGDKVSPELASKIILKCADPWSIVSNDHDFDREILSIMSGTKIITKRYEDFNKHSKCCRKISKRFNTLPLYYLELADRISSCYLGGPHGWIDWEGNVFCDDFNIGKWPDVEGVYNEWCSIAKEFPELNLKCQLFNNEHGILDWEEDDEIKNGFKPIIQFNVSKGEVTMEIPENFLTLPKEGSFVPKNRGVTIPKFKKAVKEFFS